MERNIKYNAYLLLRISWKNTQLEEINLYYKTFIFHIQHASMESHKLYAIIRIA